MAKRNTRRPFQAAKPTQQPKRDNSFKPTGEVFSFFKDYGVRETIESLLVAVVLALMFRAYEAEAFIIPTGSMAPSLQGQHMDVVCEECGYQYRAGASATSSTTAESNRARVTKTYCPICRHGMAMRANIADHVSNEGDRILVNKFVYDFKSPERFDVIVFKNPNNGKQNYIKRLIGLPGDNLLLENGDIYNFVQDADGKTRKQIVRKPIEKVPVMLQLVDDSHHIPAKFKIANYPLRWSQWNAPDTDWKRQESSGKVSFTHSSQSNELSWLRYRHLAPRTMHDEITVASRNQNRRLVISPETEWDDIEEGVIPPRIQSSNGVYSPGALIRDHYEYNDRVYRLLNQDGVRDPTNDLSSGAHWVGDLGVEFEIEIQSETGTLAFDLVEGGVHFRCTIDVATGAAELTAIGFENGAPEIEFESGADRNPTAKTALQGSGSYRLRYANMDDQVYLWINDRNVEFDGAAYRRTLPGRPIPRYSSIDPGDAEPVGIAAADCSVDVNRIRVYRDIYYVSPIPPYKRNNTVRNETGFPIGQLVEVYENPQLWSSAEAIAIFNRPVSNQPVYQLDEKQYFPLGDNSPASQDARIWDGPRYVSEEFLIGRAMFIYWPHSLNSPVRFFPNFKRMDFIR